MKAKYYHYGTDCIIYDQAICEDNIFVQIKSWRGSWAIEKPEVETKVCITNAEARRLFHYFCQNCKDNGYACEYVEYN